MKKENIVVRIMRHMGWYNLLYPVSLLLSVLSGVISLGAYLFVYHVAKEIVSVQGNYGALNLELIKAYGWKAVFFVSMSFGCYGMALAFSHIVAFNTVARVRVRLVHHLSRLPLGFYALNPSGKLRKIIEKNTDELEHFIAHQMPDTAQAVITPLAFLMCIFYFDWRLALVCVIPVIAGFILLGSMLGGESEEFLQTYQKSSEAMGNDVVEYVRGISVVKAFGQTVFSFKSFSQAIEKYRDYLVKYALSMKNSMSGYIACVYGIFFLLVPAAIIFFNNAHNPKQLILSYIFFVVLTPMIAVMLMRVMDSSFTMMIIVNALDSVESEILEKKSLPQTPNPKNIPCFDIAFNSVNFRYEKEANRAIENLTFKSSEGTITALVGPSGGGKTTVLNVLSRFWDVESGNITIGGVDLREIDYQKLMNNISIVFQETNLFKMSIADNVSFSNPAASRDDILHALHLAQCDDIIEKLPRGMDTVIGTKGVYISGGEMQRIAIARAILKKASILLLDEATAFMDPENEHKIQKALHILMKGKTVFMIAHRLSTIAHANQILVLQGRALVESGTHNELMKKDQVYASMYKEYMKSTSWKIGGKVCV